MPAELHLVRGRAFSEFHKRVIGTGNGSAPRAMHGAEQWQHKDEKTWLFALKKINLIGDRKWIAQWGSVTIKMVCKNHNGREKECLLKSDVDAGHSERFRKEEEEQGEEEGGGGKREKEWWEWWPFRASPPMWRLLLPNTWPEAQKSWV